MPNTESGGVIIEMYPIFGVHLLRWFVLMMNSSLIYDFL